MQTVAPASDTHRNELPMSTTAGTEELSMGTWSNVPIDMRFRTIDGLSIRFAESENRDDHALLLSPWPERLLAFEPTWTRLTEHTHLVALDLPGFGHSQRRDELLSPRAMGAFVVRIADMFELEWPHVIGPSVAAPAALFAASLRYVPTYPTDLPILRDLLPQIWTPLQIIAGARDSACRQ
jgi:hypothetical protein